VNGQLVFLYNMGGSEQKIIETRGRLDDGRYHYVTFIRDGNRVTVQVDDLSQLVRTHGMCLPPIRFNVYRVAQKTGPPYLIANILKIP